MKKTVKEIFEEGKAINLMTPVGYIYLNADQVKKVMSGEKKVIMNAGVRGTERRCEIFSVNLDLL